LTGLPRTVHASRTESLPKARTRATSLVSRSETGRMKGIRFGQREFGGGIKRERLVEVKTRRFRRASAIDTGNGSEIDRLSFAVHEGEGIRSLSV
jgi:hypothetical protein